jgi:uncharacterized membrane protein
MLSAVLARLWYANCGRCGQWARWVESSWGGTTVESAFTFELAILGFEYAGVAVLVIGAIVALGTFVPPVVRGQNFSAAFEHLRRQLEKTILLGLELLIVADIIRSVTIETTFQSIGALGLLVVIRTFLSWSLEVEIEGEWPWDRARSRSAAKAKRSDGDE